MDPQARFRVGGARARGMAAVQSMAGGFGTGAASSTAPPPQLSPSTIAQRDYATVLCGRLGRDVPHERPRTKAEATLLIDELLAEMRSRQ